MGKGRARRRVAWTVATLAVVATVLFFAYEAAESPASQLFGSTLVHGPSTRKIVALTYDDGPNPPYTTQILHLLRQERVHATFFLVGRAVAAYPSVARAEVADGDAIGNHTWDHDHLVLDDRAALRRTLDRTEEAIVAATGTRTTLMRPPYGGRDWLVLEEVRRLGYTPVMWSIPLPHDWDYPTAQTIARRVLRYVGDGSIIDLHDGNQGILCAAKRLAPHVCDRSADVEATRLIVETLKRRGYRFVTIPQMLALNARSSAR